MKNLAEGSTYRNLIGFAVPIQLGNILQLTYNAADSVIVGRCAGEQALAAVGISNPVIGAFNWCIRIYGNLLWGRKV